MLSPYTLSLCAFAIFVVEVNGAGGDRFLHVPDNITTCLNRPKHWQWPPPGPYNMTYNDGTQDNNGIRHYYFYSNDVKETKGRKMDWLDARNLCRQYCMDAVSIESVRENQMLYAFFYNHGGNTTQFNYTRWHEGKYEGTCGPRNPINETKLPAICNPASEKHCCNMAGNCAPYEYYWDCGCLECVDYKEPVNYFWTSGRLCDFPGCENRSDLLPLAVNGWFWSASNVPIHPTNTTDPYWGFIPWSYTGHTGKSQPDNAELDVNGTPESCLAVSKDLYSDGIQWHDIGCYHKKTVICEDSEQLLEYINTLAYPQ